MIRRAPDRPGRSSGAFFERFGSSPDATCLAPGRLNLVGEHTDYNGGQALPIALGLRTSVALRRRGDGIVAAASVQRGGPTVEVALDALDPRRAGGWTAYVHGVLWHWRDRLPPGAGADLLVDGDVPVGAGLSSSAALTCATAAAIDAAFDLGLTATDIVRGAAVAESDYVGVPCGLLDQTAAVFAQAGHAVHFDPGALVLAQVPLAALLERCALVVVPLTGRHQLGDGQYADRRTRCEQAARSLGVSSLGELAPHDLSGALTRVDPAAIGLVRHVVTEIARVHETVELLRGGGDRRRFGALLSASHRSLRDDFGVSTVEADTVVAGLVDAGALGARMVGGGFGGAVFALVEHDRLVDVVDRHPGAFSVTPGEGLRPQR
jgi:galactokinase